MTKTNVIDAIIRLPSDFNNLSNVSMFSLLHASGYFSEFEKISEETIREQLEKTPDRVEDWLVYSEDKRSVPGWYFKSDDEHKYVVGYIAIDGPTKEQYEYDNQIAACAAFIKKEVEGIRKTAQ